MQYPESFREMVASELVNHSTIARDPGVSSQTIRGYLEILEDSLLGVFLPACRLRRSAG